MRDFTTGFILVVLAIIGAGQVSLAQVLPLPTTAYPAAEHWGGHPQVFTIDQDARGMMYFGGWDNLGVMGFDGTNWDKNPIGNGSFVRSLVCDNDGRIYAGGYSEFGYFEPTEDGELEYVSMSAELPEEWQDFEYVWDILMDGETKYFQTKERLFVMDGEIFKTFVPEEEFHTCHLLDGDFYIVDTKRGLLKMEAGDLVPAKGMQEVADIGLGIYTMLPFDGSRHLLLSNKGLMFYVPDAPQGEKFIVWDCPVAPMAKAGITYSGLVLPNGNFAIGTIRSGLLIINRKGELVDHLDQSTGLTDDNVWTLFLDNDDNLWLGQDMGVSLVEVTSPLRFTNHEMGFDVAVEDLEVYDGQLFMGTRDGTYYYDSTTIRALEEVGADRSVFDPINLIDNKTFNLTQGHDALLAGAQQGLYRMVGLQKELVVVGNFRTAIEAHDYPGFFVGCDPSVVLFDQQGGSDSLVEIEEIPACYDIIENTQYSEGVEVWGGTHSKEIVRMRFYPNSDRAREITIFDSTAGFRYSEVNVLKYDDAILFGCDSGVYAFDESTQRFFEDERFIHYVQHEGKEERVGVFRMTETTNGNILAVRAGGWYLGAKKNATEWEWSDSRFKPIEVGDPRSVAINPESGVIYFGGLSGLASYDPALPVKIDSTIEVLIREVGLGEDSILFAGTFRDEKGGITKLQPVEKRPALPYSFNSITLHYSALIYTQTEGTEYSYVLENFDEEWSAWSSTTYRRYTNLDAGDYTFLVKARNAYEFESEPTEYHFTILPPWYQTLWAYLMYAVVSILIIAVAVKLNSRRLIKANQRLQELVDEKTYEVREQKEEIEAQRDDIAKKNKSLTDSINYAKTLQQAILPAPSLISEVFPQHFVFFRPRDIVSGDFYYFHEKEDKAFFAAIDCTGHGVPGALVSMTGSNFLNQVIVERDLDDPGEILSGLNAGVKSVFKKQGSMAEANDGMDIALCVYHKADRKIRFAGAHNPMVVIRNGEIHAIKGDRTPIGGRTGLDYDFTVHEFQCEPGDWVYVFSDGFPDQFGGPDNRKYMVSRFKKFLVTLEGSSPEQRVERLDNELVTWQGRSARIDDVLVFGVQIPE